MNTKSNLRGALAILSTSCILNAHADMLSDPLGPLPKDVSRAVKANVTSAASPASAPIAKPTATPAPAPAPAPAAPVPSPASSQVPNNGAPVVSVMPSTAPAQVSTPVSTNPATHERPVFTNANRETFRELDQWRTQNALLAEMVKNSEMKAKLGNQGATAGQSTANAATSTAFQVLSVEGVDDNLTALVTLANGTTHKARTGFPIPGLGKVKSISRDEVIVTTKAGPRSLDFAPKGSLFGVR